MSSRARWRGWKSILLGGLAAPLGLGFALAGEPLPPPGKSPPVVAVAPPAGLAGLQQLALEHQPSLKAYRASLAATRAKADALGSLPAVAGLVRKDLPTRRMQ